MLPVLFCGGVQTHEGGSNRSVSPISDCDPMQTVLICGMASEAFMSDLLREMDHGPSALPAGSSLTLLNSSSTPETVARVKQRNRCAPA